MTEDFGSLNLSTDEVTYTYKGETYRLSSHPFEPCLYLWRDNVCVCTLHNAYNPEDLVKAFTAGKTITTNYAKDYDLPPHHHDKLRFVGLSLTCNIISISLTKG